MTSVFTPCAGVVEISRPDCASAFFTIQVDKEPINGILTGVSVEMSGNYQFLHTVNNFIYFYAFGDRVGVITLTGVGFVAPCPGVKKGALLELYKYYTEKRAAKAGGKAMSLTIAAAGAAAGTTKTFRGFLTGMRMDIKSAESVGTVGYWTLRFEVIPERSSK